MVSTGYLFTSDWVRYGSIGCGIGRTRFSWNTRSKKWGKLVTQRVRPSPPKNGQPAERQNPRRRLFATTIRRSCSLLPYFAYQRRNSLDMTELIRISPVFPWIHLLLSRDYLLQILLVALIDLSSVYRHVTAKCTSHWLIWFPSRTSSDTRPSNFVASILRHLFSKVSKNVTFYRLARLDSSFGALGAISNITQKCLYLSLKCFDHIISSKLSSILSTSAHSFLWSASISSHQHSKY